MDAPAVQEWRGVARECPAVSLSLIISTVNFLSFMENMPPRCKARTAPDELCNGLPVRPTGHSPLNAARRAMYPSP